MRSYSQSLTGIDSWYMTATHQINTPGGINAEGMCAL